MSDGLLKQNLFESFISTIIIKKITKNYLSGYKSRKVGRGKITKGIIIIHDDQSDLFPISGGKKMTGIKQGRSMI